MTTAQKKWLKTASKKVMATPVDGNKSIKYDSISAAARSIQEQGLSINAQGARSNITKAISNKNIAYGYMWKINKF